MAGKLEVSFNSPQCGWMSVGFSDGANEFHTTTAHAPHELALRELLKILTELLDEASDQKEHVVKWNRDPEAFDFRFMRDGENARFEIDQFPTDARLPEEREVVFSYFGPLREFCESFAATFEQLYQDRETDEFEFNWRQPFPIEDFDKFEFKLAEGLLK